MPEAEKKKLEAKARAKLAKPKLWNDLTEDQILQLTSNLSAGLPGGNVRDWMAVARYWQEQHDKLSVETWDMRRRVLRLALDLNE